ncbi:uncharacterized protein LOC123003826 [Tribolium madens]|uniref:uncharacterized protein LOC123003826 n=1 Tax=Tribolium madens TaxID=41895 RepID=UPI001CF72A2F|nr:uncharacterized protein LOC123003826 [Tribolium madens]
MNSNLSVLLFILLGIYTIAVRVTDDSDEDCEDDEHNDNKWRGSGSFNKKDDEWRGLGSFDKKSNKYAFLRNPKSGLVLAAYDDVVTVEYFNGYPAQLWKAESASPGTFYVINKASGKIAYMDYKGRKKINQVITIPKYALNENNKWSGKWFINSDNTIVTSRDSMALTISGENISAGNEVLGTPKNGRASQLFIFQYD